MAITGSFMGQFEPSYWDANDKKIPMFFSLKAAAMMEEMTGYEYVEIINRLFEVEKDGEGGSYPPLSMRDQAIVVACLVHEGERLSGVKPRSADEIRRDIEDLHMVEWREIVRAATSEILNKTALSEKSKKNE